MSFTPFPVPCPTVFSFSLYGDKPKYTIGMIKNAEHIPRRFPGAEVWVYIANDVPTPIRNTLQSLPAVRLIDVAAEQERMNSFDRFMAHDDIATESVLFVRDADSRVHERDAMCIEDFLLDPTKKLHIIRDHRWGHIQYIMAGMWGIRKDGKICMRDLLKLFQTETSHIYNGDQVFLRYAIYPWYIHSAMIHDDYHFIDGHRPRTPFRYPVINHACVGQAYDIMEDGSDKAIFV